MAPDNSLQAYLEEEVALPPRDVRARLRDHANVLFAARPHSTTVPVVSWQTLGGSKPSAHFRRMIGVPGRSLPDALASFWRRPDTTKPVAVGRRLVLSQPRFSPGGGCTAEGRLRWVTRWQGVPVTLELWPHLDGWTMCTLRPTRRLRTSKRYFRAGNRALTLMSVELGRACSQEASSTTSAVSPR